MHHIAQTSIKVAASTSNAGIKGMFHFTQLHLIDTKYLMNTGYWKIVMLGRWSPAFRGFILAC